MIPKSTILRTILNQLKAENDSVYVVYAHNFIFEERVSADRHRDYEDSYSPNQPDLRSWRVSHTQYVKDKIQVHRTPDTFTRLNQDALLLGLAEEQYILRIERLDAALGGMGYNLADFAKHLDKWRNTNDREEKEDAFAFLDDFCKHWNDNVRRDKRPAFAAFYDELEEDIGDSGWPDRLRNRLGLSHYDVPSVTSVIPVALMRYRVSKVLQGLEQEEKDRAFSVPTVLDSELNAHFFPSPGNTEYGHTLDLEPDPDCERLVSEILHRRIDYHPDDIYKLGNITTPIPPYYTGDAFAMLRNGHLFCLRYESGIDAFGEDIQEHGNS
jgi:hypothetical protein